MCGNGDPTGSAVLGPGLARLFLFMTTPQLLQALHLPDADIIGALTVDHLIPEVPLTSAQINRYGLKRCP
jgi:hypothetical protein